jgi:hypothetical protein
MNLRALASCKSSNDLKRMFRFGNSLQLATPFSFHAPLPEVLKASNGTHVFDYCPAMTLLRNSNLQQSATGNSIPFFARMAKVFQASNGMSSFYSSAAGDDQLRI